MLVGSFVGRYVLLFVFVLIFEILRIFFNFWGYEGGKGGGSFV